MYSLYRKESKNSKMHGSLYKTDSVVVVKCEGHAQQELTPVNPKEWSWYCYELMVTVIGGTTLEN